MSIDIVYFSNYSGNTNRFVEKLNGKYNATRLPIAWSKHDRFVYPFDFVLFVPTYGGGKDGHAIPRSVREFLNVPENRQRLKGVVGFGNTNFGEHFCKAADMISQKTGVPVIAKVEIFGTDDDVIKVNERLGLLYG